MPRFYEDLAGADTAAALGCAVGAVKSQTWKARARLPNQASADGLTNPGGAPSWTR